MLKMALSCLVASLALAIAAPASAYAATGIFFYWTTSWQVMPSNPANGVCHSLNGAASVVRNDTDTPAAVFSDFHCQVPIGVAAAGAELQVSTSGSVLFLGL